MSDDQQLDQEAGYELEQQEELETNLDPQLQKVLVQSRSGLGVDPTIGRISNSGRLAIDVLARLRAPDQPVPGLKVVRVIGDIVTGTVAVEDIESVRSDANVISLKAARKMHGDLKFSVPEINASQKQLRAAFPAGSAAINGAGVIVGIVDFGCDFVHNNFRNADGTTRILFLWDQGNGEQTSISPQGFAYGREFSSTEITAALQSAEPYQTLAYQPEAGAHGTHVMDIAAGNGRATGNPGVALQADIIFVQIASNDFADEQSFGNSRHLLEAVDYIFAKAKLLGKFAAVNISLGTNGGPHDGSTPVELGLDHLLESPGRAVVIAASNSWGDRIHAAGTIAPGQTRSITWQIPVGDQTDNELEIWYSGSAKLAVALRDPSGKNLGPFPLGTTTKIKVQGKDAGVVFHRQKDPNNGDNQIDILLGSNLPKGNWIVLLSTEGSTAVGFHAWIERDDFAQSRLSPADDDRTHTVGSISCGKNTLVVGSYDATVPGRDISFFSSEGPTRDGRRKPEASAPGHGIEAARALSQGTIKMSGTSMASPHVTGLIALLMQAAGTSLTIQEIRDAVINVARQQPPPGIDGDSRYGKGRVDASATALTHFKQPPVASLVAESISVTSAVDTDNRLALALTDLLQMVARSAPDARLRMRIEIESEPLSSQPVSLKS